jgi:hypothetical protein
VVQGGLARLESDRSADHSHKKWPKYEIINTAACIQFDVTRRKKTCAGAGGSVQIPQIEL